MVKVVPGRAQSGTKAENGAPQGPKWTPKGSQNPSKIELGRHMGSRWSTKGAKVAPGLILRDLGVPPRPQNGQKMFENYEKEAVIRKMLEYPKSSQRRRQR